MVNEKELKGDRTGLAVKDKRMHNFGGEDDPGHESFH